MNIAQFRVPAMDYVQVFGIEFSGLMLVGPSQGKIYPVTHQFRHHWTLRDAFNEAESRRTMIDGPVRVISRQWFDKKPALPEGAAWVTGNPARGGFVFQVHKK